MAIVEVIPPPPLAGELLLHLSDPEQVMGKIRLEVNSTSDLPRSARRRQGLRGT